LLQPERRDITAVTVYALAVAVLSLASPIAVESLVNTVAFGVLMWPVIVLAGVFATCLALAAAIRAMQIYVIECLQRRLFARVVADYAHRLPRVKLESLDHRHGPELANRFFDVLNVQKSLANLLLDGVALIVTALVGMVVLAFYHPFLIGFNVLLIICIAFILFVLGIGGIRTCLHESHAKYDVAAWLEELLRGLRGFKFAGGQQFVLDKADRLATEYIAARRAHFRVVWRQTVFSLGLQVVAGTILLGLGGWLVINRQLTLGQLVASELIVSLVVASVAKLGKYTETFYDLMTGAEKLGLLTDLPLERDTGEPLEKLGGGIAIHVRGLVRVSQRNLPNPVDWHVAANERVAVIGPQGSGKTTVFEVLCGLRDPGQGVVELDGIDVRGLALEHLRDQVALVDGADIFQGTVIDNIRVGRYNLSYTQIREALQIVGLTDVIHTLPQGLDTPLTPIAGPLSTSQALRLTLARALVGRPRLLILDGVLDQLDHRHCPNLLPSIFDRSVPWTLIVSGTSPNIVGMCDRIISLSEGDNADSVPLPPQGANQ
jgi:ABC-type bacteriocin/lantibiotic exporter with double-glycine peptidase domain